MLQLLRDTTQNIEFKESWQDEYLKCICAFANSNGGILYIGVDDKGFVKGIPDFQKLTEIIPLKMRTTMGLFCPVKILTDDDKRYIKITVEKYPFPVSYHGKYYKRVGSTTQELTGVELDKFVMLTQGRTWDSIPVPNVSIDDLDILSFRLFRKKALVSERMDEESLKVSDETLIHNLHLFEQNYLTRAVILAFHGEPENWFIGSYIKIGFFLNETDISYQDEVHGPLLYQVEKTIDLVYTKYMKALISYDDGIHRKETFFFPKEAFRELILNAVVHKDYSNSAPIQIRVYKDRLVIWNAGEFPSTIRPSNIYNEHVSTPHNPYLANVFFGCGFIESWGRGYSKIKEYCEREHANLPKIEFKQGGVSVSCFASPTYINLSNQIDNMI